jgi:hypothetical protein
MDKLPIEELKEVDPERDFRVSERRTRRADLAMADGILF